MTDNSFNMEKRVVKIQKVIQDKINTTDDLEKYALLHYDDGVLELIGSLVSCADVNQCLDEWLTEIETTIKSEEKRS